MSSGGEVECTGWSGGVAHYISSDEELAATSGGSEDEVDELSGSELEEVIQQNRERSARGMAAGQPALAPLSFFCSPTCYFVGLLGLQ